jgi:hypothetical protein
MNKISGTPGLHTHILKCAFHYQTEIKHLEYGKNIHLNYGGDATFCYAVSNLTLTIYQYMLD